MKSVAVLSLTLLSLVASLAVAGAEKDAAGCKDHPLVPRFEGFYIAGCSSAAANADFDLPGGDGTDTVHVEGPSTALMYKPQPDAPQKPTEAKLKADFENAMKKQGATLAGITSGQNWPAYKLLRDGKEFWIVLLVNGGEYFTGSYTVRVIEKSGGK